MHPRWKTALRCLPLGLLAVVLWREKPWTVRLSGGRTAKCLGDGGETLVLPDVAGHPDSRGLSRRRRVVGTGQDDHPCPRMVAHHLTGGVEAVAVRKRDVDEEEVGVVELHRGHRLRGAGRGGLDREASRRESVRQRLEKHAMVVADDDAHVIDRSGRRRWASRAT